MRGNLALAALASGCIVGTTSAALTDATGVTVTANGWDTRFDGWGCPPSGCVAENVFDGSIEPDSRWACRPSRSEIEVCELSFTFDQPQDISEIRMAMFKGNERNRTVNVLVDGVLSTTVVTSANTLELEAYAVSATQASTIVLQEAGAEENVWLSITEVQLMTDTEGESSSPGPVPTSDEYVGCFSDMVGDRVLTTVTSDDAMTLEDCAAKCGETSKYYYGLQQGNECWCAGCDITERETNTDFDRHGDGICSTACAGDSTSTCGGDMSISLYQTTTCLATPVPTPAVSSSECPSGSTEASLEVTVAWEDSYWGVTLHVVEPGGTEVYGTSSRQLGDVGMTADGRDGTLGPENPATETYLTLNGLNVVDDAVLGDYEIWGTASEGTKWTITARSGGELLWIAGGTFSEFQEETERLTATVTSYADSDCTLDSYDKCPSNSFSSDGLPPCTACASGLVASGGSEFCTAKALRDLDLPENIASAIIADESDDARLPYKGGALAFRAPTSKSKKLAAAGWAGPGRPELDVVGEEFFKLLIADGAESGTISVTGNFERDEETAVPASTALFLYLHNEDDETDFMRGQGEIDPATGDFAITITDFPIGYSKGILSLVVLDPTDGGDDSVDDTVFVLDVVNEGCSEALRIKLEWDSNDDLDLWVTDPNGKRVSYYNKATDIGYVNHRNGGGWTAGNPDTGFASSFEEYVVFSGLSGDAMLGEYRFFARRGYAPTANNLTLTVTMGGAVLWVEEGVLDGSSSTMTDDDDTFTYNDSARRRLFTDDYSSTYTSYSSTYDPQTETFTVTLDSYDPVGC